MKGVSIKFGDVIAEVNGLRNGAGFLLYVTDGVLDVLEGYSYGEQWPSTINNFKLGYTKGKERDFGRFGDVLNVRPEDLGGGW
jgi:hypothetical protein